MQNLDKTREFKPVNIAVLTVSDSRTNDTDKSGDYLVRSILKEGHLCNIKKIVKDEVDNILQTIESWLKFWMKVMDLKKKIPAEYLKGFTVIDRISLDSILDLV